MQTPCNLEATSSSYYVVIGLSDQHETRREMPENCV
jgi:hypothetical protein